MSSWVSVQQLPKGKYHVFAAEGCYPLGGFSDHMFSFTTYREFIGRFEKKAKTGRSPLTENSVMYQIYEVETGKVYTFNNRDDMLSFVFSGVKQLFEGKTPSVVRAFEQRVNRYFW